MSPSNVPARPWRPAPAQEGVFIDVRLTPRSSKDAVKGMSALSDGRPVLVARVRAVPEKGAANAALEKLIAKTLKQPKSAATVISGATARLKTLQVHGSAEELTRMLETLFPTER